MNESLIKQLKDKTGDIISLFQSLLSEIATLDKRSEFVDKQERENRIFEKELFEKEKKLQLKEVELNSQKDFIDKGNRELVEKNDKIGDLKKYQEEIKKEEENFYLIKSDALKESLIAEDKIKEQQVQYESFIKEKLTFVEESNKQRTDLKKKEAIIEKSNTLDSERKRLLDKREERIKLREKQLQLEIES